MGVTLGTELGTELGTSLGTDICSGATPEAPETITGLHSWWRGDYGITLTGGAISSWADKVSGRTLSQSTAANRPVEYTSTPLGSQNTAYFDGVNDHLISDDAASTWKFMHDGTGYTSIVIWDQWGTAATYIPLISTSATFPATTQIGTTNAPLYGVGTGYQIYLMGNGSGRVFNQQVSGLTVGTGAHWSQCFYTEGASPEGGTYLDNVLRASGASLLAPSASNPDITLRVGGNVSSIYGQCAIAEILLYTKTLSAGDISSLATYFNTRYGTAW